MFKAHAFRWEKAFKDEKEGVYDEQRAGFLSHSGTSGNLTEIKEFLDYGRWVGVQIIAENLELTKWILDHIVTEKKY